MDKDGHIRELEAEVAGPEKGDEYISLGMNRRRICPVEKLDIHWTD